MTTGPICTDSESWSKAPLGPATLVFTYPTVRAVAFNPSSVLGGQNSTGTVTLCGPAPPAGVQMALSSDSRLVSVPASVTVAAGATSATFAVQSSAVPAETVVHVTASANGSAEFAILAVEPEG